MAHTRLSVKSPFALKQLGQRLKEEIQEKTLQGEQGLVAFPSATRQGPRAGFFGADIGAIQVRFLKGDEPFGILKGLIDCVGCFHFCSLL